MNPLTLAGTIIPTDQEITEGFLLRRLDILGIGHHAEFIRVENGEDNLQRAWVSPTADPDNQSRYEDMQHSYDGYYATIQLGGVDWVFRAFPFSDF